MLTRVPTTATTTTGFDQYSRGLLVWYAIDVHLWSHPGARDVVPPTYTGPTVHVSVGLAMNITVPVRTERWSLHDVSQSVANYGGEVYARLLPFPVHADECGAWESELATTPQLVLTKLLQPPMNPTRVLVPWGADKYTDKALSDLMFHGIGQHRLQAVRAHDPHKADAVYACYLGVAEELATRAGFATLGADAYFDARGTLLFIRRLNRTVLPTERPTAAYQVSDYRHNQSDCLFYGGTWVGGWMQHQCSARLTQCTELGGRWLPASMDCHVPARDTWAHVKMVFRGTLSAIVTLLDHLYAIHLVVSNAVVTANTETLHVNEPLRRLLHPFVFGTTDINYRAATVLVTEYGMIHRATGLDTVGLRQLYAYARTTMAGITWSSLPARHAAQGIRPDVVLPLHEDGGDFYAVLLAYVRAYIHLHYDKDCSPLQDWWTRLNELTPAHDLPPLTQCDVLVEVVATILYMLTAGHHHVGAIGAEVEDPCYAPWSFREHAHCGLPRTSLVQLITMATTSNEQPKLLGDYTHLFRDEPSKYMWRTFQANLTMFQTRVAVRNTGRHRPVRSFDLDLVEICVGV